MSEKTSDQTSESVQAGEKPWKRLFKKVVNSA